MKKKKAILLICLCVIIGCGAVLIWQEQETYRIRQTAEEARLAYDQALAKQSSHTPTNSPAPTNKPTAAEPHMPSPSLTPTLTPTPTPKEIQQEFIELRSKYDNEDIVGYLKITGTSIDYPVTHSGDNLFYLHHDIKKQTSEAGWIFMDFENDVENDDPNTILYGHNMRQDIMFHSLRYYQSWNYFNNHRYVIFNTIYENHVWEVFSFYRTDTNFQYIQVVFPSDDAFNALASEMKARSMYDTGVDIKPGDRILTLSTCTNESEDTRFVLNARRLSPDEIPEDLVR